jgi:molybdopterin-guanine dinucleotide biosynthesis protein MobB
MKRIHILGRKNHGKTTFIVELVQQLASRGLRVGTIKHTHHAHELDAPGKDSHRHREAGAQVVGILSRAMNAVFWPPEAQGDDRYDEFSRLMGQCDVVLVEGDTQTAGPKVEVWRAAVGSPPLASEDPSIRAVITDDAVDVAADLWPRSDMAQTTDHILRLLNVVGRS